jgi:hypothetical protein
MNATPSSWPDPKAALYTSGEVAALFKVDPRVPARWVKTGKFPEGTTFTTPGGHRRFDGDYIRKLRAGGAR